MESKGKQQKRYCLQEIHSEDKDLKLTSWKNTKYCSDSLEVLKIICPEGKRIFDTKLGIIVYEP